MIFLAAGTQDGRELAGYLLSKGYSVTASAVSSYGGMLLKKYPGIVINDEPLDEEGLVEYIGEHSIKLFVDASHPYAANVSQNAMNACKRTHIPYIRYERKAVPVDYDKVYAVDGYEEASKKAASLGKNVFLTTGSRNLKAFAESPYLKDCVLTVRLLPTAKVIAECTELGFSPKNIVALQGPFSTELNIALYRQYEADVIVTKNSGEVGGTDTKLEAAKALGLPVVMIDRPKITYDEIAYTFEDIAAFAEKHIAKK